jgi:hypothetical protein
MAKRGTLTKILAVTGTVLVWFPILAPIVLSLAFFVSEHLLRIDYLMPAELFLFALAGGALLIWAALRARARRALIGWSLGIAAGLLVGSQALADATGLASGEREPEGLLWAVMLAALAIFTIALIVAGVGGALLVRDLFKTPRLPTEALHSREAS